MVRRRHAYSWLIGALGAIAFVAGASAQSGGRPSQGVVTPDSPIFGAQDPVPTPAPAPAPETPDTPDTPAPDTPSPATPPPAQVAGPQQGAGGGGRGGRGAQRTYPQLLA
jgi:hypothetical protein